MIYSNSDLLPRDGEAAGRTYEGQQFVTYNLEVESTPGWVLRNQLSDVMYSGGLWAETRIVHEMKNLM